jgi:DTW domain-containing protein YfiP
MIERVDCLRCRRPPGLCVCDVITPVANRTGVTIVEHPRERTHPFGTARLCKLGLANVDVHVAWPQADGRLTIAPALPAGTALLYPSAHAVELADVPPAQRPRHMLVLDGTWSLVRPLYRDNPWMAALPHVRLSPDRPGAYRIRREPAAHCLSTIESIAAALRILEPGTAGLDGLLDGFTALVDRQLDRRGRVVRASGARRKLRARQPVLERLATSGDRLVIAHGDVTGGVLRGWSAFRPATGATFEASLADQSVAELVAAWSGFTGPDDVVVTWREDSARAFQAVTGLDARFVQLKSAWCHLDPGPTGRLGELVARLGLVPPRVALSGPAALHVADAVALTAHLGTIVAARGSADTPSRRDDTPVPTR